MIGQSRGSVRGLQSCNRYATERRGFVGIIHRPNNTHARLSTLVFHWELRPQFSLKSRFPQDLRRSQALTIPLLSWVHPCASPTPLSEPGAS